MNLNSMGAGKKLLKKVVDQGNIQNMRWTSSQIQEAIDTQKNPCNYKNRSGNE